MNPNEFNEFVSNQYGDKVIVRDLTWISEEDLDKLNSYALHNNLLPIAYDDLVNYGEWAWVEKCPQCNSELGGLFGTFKWGIIHGYGECSECGTEFKYYHRPAERGPVIKGWAIVGTVV